MSLQAGFLVPHPPLIIPEVGRGHEEKIEATIESYKEVAKRIKKLAPDTMIIITPHAPAYVDYFQLSNGEDIGGSFIEYGAMGVRVEADIDNDLNELIIEAGEKRGLSLGYQGNQHPLDHGAMIPLHFSQEEYDCPIVRLSISGFSLEEHYTYGLAIQEAIKKSGKDVVIIISGDLSHRLDRESDEFSEDGVTFDSMVRDVFKTGEFMPLLSLDEVFLESAAECGMRPLVMFMGAVDGYDVEGEWLSYEAPFGVGYGVGELLPTEKNEKRSYLKAMNENSQKRLEEVRKNESEIVRLARYSLETAVKTGDMEEPDWQISDDLLKDTAGVFVTLNIDGKLRGCIGTLAPTQESVAKEVMQNALSAGLNDHRFPPVTKEELESMTYSVDVLGEAETVSSIKDLDVHKYGVIVELGTKRGVLLPNIDTVHHVEDQVSIALEKAGIEPEENYELKRFEVVRHH